MHIVHLPFLTPFSHLQQTNPLALYNKAYDRLSKKLESAALPTIKELSFLLSLALNKTCIHASTLKSAVDRIELIASMYLTVIETDEKKYDHTIAFISKFLKTPLLFKKLKKNDELILDLSETPSWLTPVETWLDNFFYSPSCESLEKVLFLLQHPRQPLSTGEQKDLEEFIYKKLAIQFVEKTNTFFPFTLSSWKIAILFCQKSELNAKIPPYLTQIFTLVAFSKRSLSVEFKLSTLIKIISYYHREFIKQRSLPSAETLTYLQEVFKRKYKRYYDLYDLESTKIMLQNLLVGYRKTLKAS